MDEILIADVMSRTMAFPLVTYVPLQAAAILMMKHWGLRIAAALPLIPMVPVIYVGFDPNSYGNGSLYGVGLYLVYTPAMAYLAIFCLVGLVNRFVCANRLSTDTSTKNDADADAETEAKSHAPILIALLVLATVIVLGLVLLPFK